MCGIFGMFGHKDAARLACLGLYALQHRGEESAGIVTDDKGRVYNHKGMGHVAEIFTESALNTLKGDCSVGHVRYSTTGSSSSKNIQPLQVRIKGHHIAVAHNGNLTNTFKLNRELEENGSIFQTSMDSEIIAHLIARSKKKQITEMVIESLGQLEGAYSLCIMFDNILIGARDTYGFRPLCLGRLGRSYVLASETCALDIINARYIRDIEPGEIVFISKKGIRSVKPFRKTRHAFCIFEYIYFARPDSNIYNNNVYITRKRLGVQLFQESPVKCDLVMPVPDSGSYAAMGFAQQSGIPFEMGMIRNHYIGRTFIQPSQAVRDFRVKIKLNPIKDIIKGKRIAVIEDSIVRGTTIRLRVKTLREAGAKEVHMRVTCPPLVAPCFYGIDFSTKKELIAARHPVKWIQKFIGVDTLKYISLQGMLDSMPLPACEFCTACFNKEYPTKLPEKSGKNILEEC